MKRKKTEIIDDISNKKNEIRQAIEKTIAEKNEKTFSLIEDFISGGFVENLGNLIIYLPWKGALSRTSIGTMQKMEFLHSCVS